MQMSAYNNALIAQRPTSFPRPLMAVVAEQLKPMQAAAKAALEPTTRTTEETH